MSEVLQLFTFDFFRNAFFAAVLTSVLAGIVGSYIVVRRSVFISGGVTHASFGGMGVAYYLGFPPFIGAAVFAIFSALGIEWSSQKSGLREDSAIAILWSLGMAIGIMFIFLTPGYTPNLMGFLFGDILTVQISDLLWLSGLTVLTLIAFILFYEPILYTAFDPEFAKVSGLPVRAIRMIVAVFIALAIVLSIKVMGIILVLSIFTIPPSAVNLFARRFKDVVWYSVLLSLVGSITGLFIAYYFDLPSGATIIFTLTAFYGIVWLIKKLRIIR